MGAPAARAVFWAVAAACWSCVYSNFDQAGSKNVQFWLVTKGDPETYDAYQAYFAAHGLPTFDVGAGGSDHESFDDAGIPVGGFSTGISDCIHEPCDDITNVDPPTETASANAVLGVTWQLATTDPRKDAHHA
ncbi:M28 family peptidase [Streptacidiphilus griseoplanus]|uniref:M28 family peptidase n=1 Tax=Peterkaempfera griseoplana TaxID=66896 RepID=UPI001FDF1943|nr:M28 family peptidase [Peterkaempfera griseoplana]